MDAVERQRVALVLAASHGIGYACAQALGMRGDHVVLCGRTAQALDDAAQRLRAAGIASVSTAVADVSSADQLAALFDRIATEFGRLDVLVANAGGPPGGGFESLSDDDWDVGYQLTLMSVVRSVRRAIRIMRKGGFGRILVIGSSSVRKPIPDLALSNAFRPAIAGIVKTLAVELGDSGITVNMVCPGRITTDRTRELDQRKADDSGRSFEDVRAESRRTIPMGEFGRPEDIASMVAYLASDDAGYVTGQTVFVDGGMVPTLP
jgi:3-oxoacyl-[acyl-carrier protein] reductase